MSNATDKSAAVAEDAKPHQAMYLSTLQISNFRSCVDTTVSLQRDLTILVGENNAGKSNIIEALRLATAPLSRRRTRYFEIDDVAATNAESPVQIEMQFAQLSEFQAAHYISAFDLTDGTATYRTTYTPDIENPRKSRVDYGAGKLGKADPEPEKREQINHVYLAPLRDANRELDSSTGNRLSLIMATLLESEQRDSFIKLAEEKYSELEKHEAVIDTKDKLQAELSLLTDAVREQHVTVSFDKLRLDRLTRNLRLKMSEFAIDPSDLANSGLGYANLLFLASVVLELSNVDESELTLFLVEEPEAHLHPQLQAVLLDYLRDQAQKSVQGDDTGPAGRIQIVATTHSPNLASNAGLDAVVVVQSERLTNENAHTNDRATYTLALAELSLGADNKSKDKGKRKIDQYLDVTRAELLFARHVILVEGIAEQIILPALAKKVVLKGSEDPDHDKERQRKFHGVSVISVGSVDFEPYIRLLLQQIDGRRLIERLVIVTDRDPLVKKDESTVPDGGIASVNTITPDSPAVEIEEEDDETVDYNRASDLRKLVTDLDAADIVYIAEAPHTLEADLIDPVADNREVFGRALLAQKPRSKKTWAALADAADPAQAFYEKLQINKNFISKGQFAHDFAIELEDPGTYKCPDYLTRAITFAIGEGPKE